MAVPEFLIWHCAGCGAAAEGKKKPCACPTNVGARKGPNGGQEQTWWDEPMLRCDAVTKPTEIKSFPGRAVEQHLRLTGSLPDETCQCPKCGRMHRHLGRPPWRDDMQPHQQRVVDEKNELDEKLDKLKAFIDTNPMFKTLGADERHRLNRQFDVMAEYSNILGQRITAFPPI